MSKFKKNTIKEVSIFKDRDENILERFLIIKNSFFKTKNICPRKFKNKNVLNIVKFA